MTYIPVFKSSDRLNLEEGIFSNYAIFFCYKIINNNESNLILATLIASYHFGFGTPVSAAVRFHFLGFGAFGFELT
jgi:hypothetical protein